MTIEIKNTHNKYLAIALVFVLIIPLFTVYAYDFIIVVGSNSISEPQFNNSTTIKLQTIGNNIFWHVNNTVIAIKLSNNTQLKNIVGLFAGSGISITKNGNDLTISNTQISLTCVSVVCRIVLNNGTQLFGNITMLGSSNIKITKNGNILSWAFNGTSSTLVCSDVVCRIQFINGTQIKGNITFANGKGTTIIKNGNTISIDDVNNTSFKNSQNITQTKVGNTVTWNLPHNYINSIALSNGTKLYGNLTLQSGSGISITKNGQILQINDVNNTSFKNSQNITITKVGNTITFNTPHNFINSLGNSTIKRYGNITLGNSPDIKLIFDSGQILLANWIGNIVRSIQINSGSLLTGAIQFVNSRNITLTNIGNVISLNLPHNYINSIAFPNATRIYGNVTLNNMTNGLYKDGNIIKFNKPQYSELIIWYSDVPTTAVINQGLDLPLVATFIDNVRHTIFFNPKDYPNSQVQCVISLTSTSGTSLTITYSIQWVNALSPPSGILCSTTSGVLGANAQARSNSTWTDLAPHQSGFISFATSGGNGANDFIFHSVALRIRPK